MKATPKPPLQFAIGRNGGTCPPLTAQIDDAGTWRLIQGHNIVQLSPNQAAELAGMMMPSGWKLVRSH